MSAEDFAIVREALGFVAGAVPYSKPPIRLEAEAALAHIEARLTQEDRDLAEGIAAWRKRAEAAERGSKWLASKNVEIQRWADGKIQAAEARLVEVEKERDGYKKAANYIASREAAAEARVVELRETAEWEQEHGGCYCRTCNSALAAAEEKPKAEGKDS